MGGDRAAKYNNIQPVEINHKQQPVTTQQTSIVPAQKDISKMTWRMGGNAPEKMFRGAAVVHGNTAYISPLNSKSVYSYQNILGKEQLPDNHNINFGLAIIDGLLTSVGGFNNDYTNTLLSLTGEGESTETKKQWSEIFPPMPIAHTARGERLCHY